MKSTPRLALSIGDVAARFSLPTHVLRFWEESGLLAPSRNASGRRVYGDDDVVRVAAIMAHRSAGLSLERIAVLFNAEAEGRRELLAEHLEELARRATEIEVAREVTQHALECESHDVTTCPRFASAVEVLLEETYTSGSWDPEAWKLTRSE